MLGRKEVEEIDLAALVASLWSGKWLIFGVTSLFFLFSFIYVKQAQEWWTANALVEAPKIFDYEDYYVSIQEFKQILNDESRDRHLEKSLDRYVAPESLLREFKTTYNSSTVKKRFLLGDAVFLKYLSDNQLSDIGRMAAVKIWSKNISASLVDKKSKEPLLILRFQSTSASSSAAHLQLYIDFVLIQSRKKMLRSIESMKKTHSLKVVKELEMLDRLTSEKLKLQVARFEHSYNIAVAASVNEPLIDQSDGEDFFPIALGSEAILARIKALKSIKKLSILEPDLLRIKAELDQLNQFSLSKHDQFSMFSYVDDIDLPLTRDKPKGALIVAVALLLGMLLGCVVVAVRLGLRAVKSSV